MGIDANSPDQGRDDLCHICFCGVNKSRLSKHPIRKEKL
jgi:hypothetical protein